MDPQSVKNIYQILIFIGTGLVLLGSVGNWYWGNRVKDYEQNERKAIEVERDKATKKLETISNKQIKLTRYFSEFDNKISNLHFEIILDKGYAANEFIDFEVYVEFNPLQTYYEITTLDAFAGGNKENKIPTQTIKAYPINKKIEKPWITTSIINIPIFDYISIDLWLINREKPDDFKLRDLQGGFFTFHIKEKFVTKIKEIRLVANNWIVFRFFQDENSWEKTRSSIWPPKNENDNIYHLTTLNSQNVRLAFSRIDLYSTDPIKSE